MITDHLGYKTSASSVHMMDFLWGGDVVCRSLASLAAEVRCPLNEAGDCGKRTEDLKRKVTDVSLENWLLVQLLFLFKGEREKLLIESLSQVSTN